MAKILAAGYTDTAIAGNPVLNFLRGSLNYPLDWKCQTVNANEIVVTNLKAPMDRPETIRISWSEKTNVYQNSGVDPSVRPPCQKGISFVIAHKRVLSCTDSVVPEFRQDVPVSVHCVVTIPAYDLLTADMLQVEIGRMLSAFFNTGLVTTERLSALMRGAVMPSDI